MLAGDGDDPVGCARALADAVGAAPDAGAARRPCPVPSRRPARSPARRSRPRSARCCPRARSSRTRRRPRACGARRDRRRAAPRAGSRSPAGRSAKACRSPPAPPSPAPTGRSSRSRPTAAAMYTLQSLWTQAREGLDVTTILYTNRSYAILSWSCHGSASSEPGPRAHRCSTSRSRRSTSSRSPVGWGARDRRPMPPSSSTTCAPRWPSPDRT